MAYIEWPAAIVPAECEPGILFNTQVSVSDLSGYVQTKELPGARWSLGLRFLPRERASWGAILEAFIARLRGQAVRARIPLFGRGTPAGTWAGTPVVDNDVGSPSLAQTGTTLQASGFSAFATVKAGDYFNLGAGGQLLMATVDAQADSGGDITLSVQPSIRTAPAHGTALVFTDPVVPLMILTDPHPRWRILPGDDNLYALDFIEVFA